MPSTLDQLQQLTNNELLIMCYNYKIAARQIAYLTRRQLERRLHVAIIEERAKIRAQDLVYGIRDQQDQLYLRQSSPQRNRGGVDYLQHLEHLRYYSEEYDTETFQNASQESAEDESMHTEKQQWQDAFKSRVEPITNNIEWDTNKETETDYYSLSNGDDSMNSINVDNNQLQKAERFAWWRISTHNLPPDTNRDSDPPSEKELRTIYYLEDLHPGEQIKKKMHKEFLEHSENIGDSQSTNEASPRQRWTLWRNILGLLCFNSQEKLDAGKLRCSIICCAIVICTFVSIKLLH